MKFAFTIIALFLSVSAFSQASLYGKKFSGPVALGNGMQLTEGDTLTYGHGTGPSGQFSYIFFPANLLVGLGEIKFPSSYAGMHGVVERFQQLDSKRAGKKVLVMVKQNRNSMVDIEAAINSGEIVAINGKSTMQQAATTGPVSVADELLKLKHLLDAGAITQAEYDAQKKKLLSN